MPLVSVLDQSPIRAGGTAAEAVAETVELAQACERWGYHRYWLAEHHASRGLAGLMEMVTPKVISTTPLRAPRRHYARAGTGTVDLFRVTVAVAFARGHRRFVALGAAMRTLVGLARGAR